MRSERYQYALILLGVITTLLFGVFLYREIFPEYKIYQDDYVALEKFRSSYTEEPVPPFNIGVKQIVLEREDKGPPIIDRCISCHVAVQLPHFSPTKIAKDINGNILRDAQGTPMQVPNEEYVWAKLEAKIAELGMSPETDYLRSLKSAKVDDHIYDVTKVLQMHPLMGKETRPFEFHPIEEYGCTSCHNGNGRGLTTEKAHGPIFDGDYEIEFMGPKPVFLEKDEKNDPQFARIFNDKPGHSLLFQTTPLYVGALIQAKCVQCHQSSQNALENLATSTTILTSQRKRKYNAIQSALMDEKKELLALIQLRDLIQKEGWPKAKETLAQKSKSLLIPEEEVAQIRSQLQFLQENKPEKISAKLNQKIERILGSKELADALSEKIEKSKDAESALTEFLQEHLQDPKATGTLFKKFAALNLDQELMQHVQDTETSFAQTLHDQKVISAISADVDELTKNYHHGQQLYISQGCYACHRIAGFARGGVGPELTYSGDNYPWFIKESIVWPQADLKTSTMPNFRLDHEELEDLVTYLLGQKGGSKAISPTTYKIAVQEWEAGKKMAWEEPVPPSEIHNPRFGMTIFATEGCAACHRLKGFESNVGYRIEKENKNADFDTLYKESQWFTQLFPELIYGSELVRILEAKAKEIDEHIVDNVREGSILEEIEKNHPKSIEALYSNFKFAARAKNHNAQPEALKEWEERVHRVLMMFVQEYGLGRLIGPRPNWSGVYRSDEWLMEHFYNPSSHVPRSIMPVFPFHESKFYALTYMLDFLGKKNRDAVKKIGQNNGFNPAEAFQIYCSQCHGEYLQGNGPVSEWIYPIPKNLRNSYFLRNLTKERALQSILHGVKGTPMPPWGEVPDNKTDDNLPVITQEEAKKIVDWIYTVLPGGNVIKGEEDVPKWKYTPKDVIEELQKEGQTLQSDKLHSLLNLQKFSHYYVDLNPQVPAEPVTHDPDVEKVFEIAPNPIPGGEKYAYYIKKKFYTVENIQAGKEFFELNCAVCHGREADGTGARAAVMNDAKPRMLTNLDWLDTRDDLRLLRSIKYGVIGTAMTPWGDQTSSLQRLQLVLFIRSLTHPQEKRKELAQALYKAFDRSKEIVEKARSSFFPKIEKKQQEIAMIQTLLSNLINQIEEGKPIPKETLELYQKELTQTQELKKYKDLDALFIELKSLLTKEKELYNQIGVSLIGLEPSEELWSPFIQMLALKENEYSYANGALSKKNEELTRKEFQKLGKEIVDQIDEKIKILEKEKEIFVGKIPSQEQSFHLNAIKAKMEELSKLKAKLYLGLEETKQIDAKAESILNQIQEKLKLIKATDG